jgi:hypothetical protein
MKGLRLNRDGSLHVYETGRDGVQQACIDFLRAQCPRWHVRRIHAGLFRSWTGDRKLRIGQKGQTDLLAFRRIRTHNDTAFPFVRLLLIEVKCNGGEGRLSLEQKLERDALLEDGLEWLKVESVDELKQYLTQESNKAGQVTKLPG